MKVIEHDETVRCSERRGRAERQRSSEEEKVDRLDLAEQKTAQAEQHCSQKMRQEVTDKAVEKWCRAEQHPAQMQCTKEMTTEETGQAEQNGSASVGCPDRAEQASSMPKDDIHISGATQITQTVRQCPTTTGPVTRYVVLPYKIVYNPIVTQNIHPGTIPAEGQHRAELQCNEMTDKRGDGQDEQNARTEQDCSKPGQDEVMDLPALLVKTEPDYLPALLVENDPADLPALLVENDPADLPPLLVEIELESIDRRLERCQENDEDWNLSMTEAWQEQKRCWRDVDTGDDQEAERYGYKIYSPQQSLEKERKEGKKRES